MIYVGIDPGKQGSVAVLDGRGHVMELEDMPLRKGAGPKGRDALDIWRMAEILPPAVHPARQVPDGVLVALEEQRAYGLGGTSAMTTGVGYGIWQTILTLRSYRWEIVEPKVWRKTLGINRLRGEDRKASCMALAGELFPRARLHTDRGRALDGRADALLIAEWLRRTKEGT